MKNQSNISNIFLLFKQDFILLTSLSLLLSHYGNYPLRCKKKTDTIILNF